MVVKEYESASSAQEASETLQKATNIEIRIIEITLNSHPPIKNPCGKNKNPETILTFIYINSVPRKPVPLSFVNEILGLNILYTLTQS